MPMVRPSLPLAALGYSTCVVVFDAQHSAKKSSLISICHILLSQFAIRQNIRDAVRMRCSDSAPAYLLPTNFRVDRLGVTVFEEVAQK